MFKTLPVFFIGLVFSLLFTSSVVAQSPQRYYDWSSTLEAKSNQVLGESTNSASPSAAPVKSYQKFNNYFGVGGLTPDQPLYFLKTWEENIQLAFTFDPIKKDEMRITIAGKKLEEIQQLAGQNKPQALTIASSLYQDNMQAASEDIELLQEQNKEIDELLKKVEEETAKHTIVLEEAAIKAPETAKSAINKAIEASWKGTDTVADLSGRPAVPTDVVDRISALKAQGLLTEEEANKLINVKSRSEAREELRKYVGEGILPEADFLRLNENVKQMFPDEFYKLHEVKRFYELKRLESEKPNEATLKRIQEFAKDYKPGEVVPGDIRRYWVPVIRLEEIQNTLRPDLIDANLINSNAEDIKKFNELVERFKPRPEDIAYVENFLKKNPYATLPPEYERMKNLGEKYGAQCGSGMRWFTMSGGGGYCAPEGSVEIGIPETEFRGKACTGEMIPAKNSTGACMMVTSDCIPSGWAKTSACTQIPGQPGSIVRNTSAGGSSGSKAISCPSNSHWVPVNFLPEGGYCIPNYSAYTTGSSSTIQSEGSCPSKYHRNYADGPCLPDYGSTTNLYPLTTTPGNYPNPIYPSYSSGTTTSSTPPVEGYNCGSQSYDPVTRRCRDGACPGGFNWNGSACVAVTYSGNSYGGSSSTPSSYEYGCTPGHYWDGSKCVQGNYEGSGWSDSAARSGSYCQSPSAGCGSGKYWDYGSCSCRTSSTYNGSTPPSGYGNCTSGQYWNGSACVSNTTSTTSPEQSCRNAGGSWNGSSCTMPASGSSGGTSTSREQQESACRGCGGSCDWNGDTCRCQCASSGSTSTQPTSAPASTSAPESQPAPTSAPSTNTNDPAAACGSAGGSWNGSSCTMP